MLTWIAGPRCSAPGSAVAQDKCKRDASARSRHLLQIIMSVCTGLRSAKLLYHGNGLLDSALKRKEEIWQQTRRPLLFLYVLTIRGTLLKKPWNGAGL